MSTLLEAGRLDQLIRSIQHHATVPLLSTEGLASDRCKRAFLAIMGADTKYQSVMKVLGLANMLGIDIGGKATQALGIIHLKTDSSAAWQILMAIQPPWPETTTREERETILTRLTMTITGSLGLMARALNAHDEMEHFPVRQTFDDALVAYFLNTVAMLATKSTPIEPQLEDFLIDLFRFR